MIVLIAKAFNDRRKISHIVGVFKTLPSAQFFVAELREKDAGVHYLLEEWPVLE